MKTTTPKQFRAELKHFLEIADKEAIRINRRSGKKYILLNEHTFLDLKKELSVLRTKIHELDKSFVYEAPPTLNEHITPKKKTKSQIKLQKKKVLKKVSKHKNKKKK